MDESPSILTVFSLPLSKAYAKEPQKWVVYHVEWKHFQDNGGSRVETVIQTVSGRKVGLVKPHLEHVKVAATAHHRLITPVCH